MGGGYTPGSGRAGVIGRDTEVFILLALHTRIEVE